jgi:hypothetical protein
VYVRARLFGCVLTCVGQRVAKIMMETSHPGTQCQYTWAREGSRRVFCRAFLASSKLLVVTLDGRSPG